MKKYLLLFLLPFFASYTIAQDELKYCGADELRISTLKKNPEIAGAVISRDSRLETFTKKYVEDFYNKKTPSATYIIPVVFHVIHKWGNENISVAQIMDGMDILNKTFRKQLADTASIVSVFKPLHADCEIEFRLAQIDPDGNCTSGINRIASLLTNVGDHSVKSIIHWPPQKYLNVYIVSNAAGLAGHCVWPSDADTIPLWDGIVIGYNYVGSIGQSTYQRSVAFAHECGHYFNLQHIWGGNNVPGFYYYPCADPLKDCDIDDLVEDTPPTIGWQSCNLSGASCGSAVDNVQNTMDYSYCNRMFTYGQKARMHASLNSSIAGRNNLWQTANLIATGVLDTAGSLCKADFTSNLKVVCEGSTIPVTFTNASYNGTFTSVLWTFPGGNPATSSSNSPSINYNSSGTYDVTLKVINGADSLEITKTNYISVLPDPGAVSPFSEGFETTNSLVSAEWFSVSFDSINNWQLTNNASYNGTKSAMIDNGNNGIYGTRDELISQKFNLTGDSGLYISFKYAHAKKDSSSKDQLQLYITNNCNNTWVQRLNLTGAGLESAPMQSSPFIPASLNEWKDTSVSVPVAWLTANFRFKFVYSSYGGNNVYLDYINLNVLSTGINESEFISAFHLSPNPSGENLTVKFTLSEMRKFEFSIVNVLGQTIYESGKKNYPEGENAINLDMKNIDQGMYFLKISDGSHSQQKALMVIAE